MKSLRGQMVLFWILLFVLCVTLAISMVWLYRSSAGVQIAEGRSTTEQSCQAIATRYANSVPKPLPSQPQLDLLQVLLQLVLIEAPHTEGGIWQASEGVLAYAYPTYEGSGVKRDVPEAEEPLIFQMSELAARTQQPQTEVVRGSTQALIVSSCPLIAPDKDLVSWTMTRTQAGTFASQTSLRLGLGVLLLVVLASGFWLGTILLRGLRHVQRIEARLAVAGSDAMPELERTGVRELDRIVDGFNAYRLRLEDALAHLQTTAQQRSRDQRLAALGRMTGSVAHEIRNPIAAMRLKAENALAGSPASQPHALHAIVGQIDRLEGLVQSLLALVQPVSLSPRSVELKAFLQERVDLLIERAATRDIHLEIRISGPAQARFDPVHMARAVDNLLDNAVRHVQSGGKVLLTATAVESKSLTIAVDDNGPGIPSELEARLFEPFATGRADGTGLGLALAREVSLAHGGDLRHVALHPGTRFELEIPWRIS